MAETLDYTLSHGEFQARVQAALGFSIGLSTLKRWAYEGIITRPQRYRTGKGGKKGRAVKWSPRAVEEACAVWAIRNSNITRAFPSIKRIEEIKRAAELVYLSPLTAVYIRRSRIESPSLNTSEYRRWAFYVRKEGS